LSVRFAGQSAHFVLASPTSIVARVPKEARIGRVIVTTPDGRAVSASVFEPLPWISSIKPQTAHPGARITIVGSNLGGAVRVTFHGRRARFHVVSPTRIVATVPRAAVGGRIIVRTRAGSAASRRRFHLLR
jgi:hypothetical protein